MYRRQLFSLCVSSFFDPHYVIYLRKKINFHFDKNTIMTKHWRSTKWCISHCFFLDEIEQHIQADCSLSYLSTEQIIKSYQLNTKKSATETMSKNPLSRADNSHCRHRPQNVFCLFCCEFTHFSGWLNNVLGALKLTNIRFTLQRPFHDQGLQLIFDKAFKMQENSNIVMKWEDPFLLVYETKNWMMMVMIMMMMTAKAHKIGAPPLRWAALISIIFPFNLADWFHHVRIGITHRIWWWPPCAWSNKKLEHMFHGQVNL